MEPRDWNARPEREPATDVNENLDHNLGSSYKTFIERGAKGLGLVVIENGSFLQIVRIVDSSPGDMVAKLRPGDILVKIGNTNVLGYKLRELRQLVGEIPTGTQLQMIVYRNYKEIPDNWKSKAGTQSAESVQLSSEEGESGLSSSSDNDDDGDDPTFRVRFNNFRPLSLFWHEPGISIPPVSRTWHASKKNRNVLLVGSHVGCDIMLHCEFEDGHVVDDSEEEATQLHTLWSRQSDTESSTSSSSSSEDSQWIRQLQGSDLDLVQGTTQHETTVDKPPYATPGTIQQTFTAETPPDKEEGQSSSSTANTSTPVPESSTPSSTESSPLHSQSLTSDTSGQFTDTSSPITTSEDFTADSSSSDTTLEDDHFVPAVSPAAGPTQPLNLQQRTPLGTL